MNTTPAEKPAAARKSRLFLPAGLLSPAAAGVHVSPNGNAWDRSEPIARTIPAGPSPNRSVWLRLRRPRVRGRQR